MRLLTSLLAVVSLSACLTSTVPTPAVPAPGGGESVSTGPSAGSSKTNVPEDSPDDATVANAPPPGGITPREDRGYIESIFIAWRAIYGRDFSKTLSVESPESVPTPLGGEMKLEILVQALEEGEGGDWLTLQGPGVLLIHADESFFKACDTVLVENLSTRGHNLYISSLAVKAGGLSFYYSSRSIAEVSDCSEGLTPLTEAAVDELIARSSIRALGSLIIEEGPSLRKNILPPVTPPMPVTPRLGPLL